MRRLARPARRRRNLCRRPIQPRNGPARCAGQRSSPTRTIISSTLSSASSWMSKQPAPFGRQRSEQLRPRSSARRGASVSSPPILPATRPMALLTCSTGLSMRRRSSLTFRSTTNQSARMAPSRAKTFRFDEERNIYVCPAGKVLTTTGHIGPDHGIRYHASLPDCRTCMLKQKCCPNMPSRRIVRDVNEAARDVARALAKTEAFERSRRYRKRVEMLFAHLKRILRLGRLRLRGPCGAQDEFTLAAIAQNLRRLSKLVARPPPVADACLA